MFEWRARRCKGEAFSQVIAGCPGTHRFATSDAPRLYKRTRARGWVDLRETASVTWNEGRTTPYPAPLGDVRRTAAAFIALTRCRTAIVAPIMSQFSETAAFAAGVPLVGCCSAVTQRPNNYNKGP